MTNDKIFDEPIYNYSRVLLFLWEEMKIPIAHGADYARAETILLDAARRHTEPFAGTAGQLEEIRLRYGVTSVDEVPRVYMRITDNWLELTVRFLVPDHGIRKIKDAMTRDIVRDLGHADIRIAIAIAQSPSIRRER